MALQRHALPIRACKLPSREKGYTAEQISELLALEIPDNEYFNSRGIYNYHGGGNIVFYDETVLNWILAKRKA